MHASPLIISCVVLYLVGVLCRRPLRRPLPNEEEGQEFRRLRRREPQPSDGRPHRHASRDVVRRGRNHGVGEPDLAQRPAFRNLDFHGRADRDAAALSRLGPRARGDDLHDSGAF